MKRTPLRKASLKYAKELHRFYAKTKTEWLEAHPGCQICGKTYGVTIHHKMRRKQYLNDKRYLMTACRQCHAWIEANKREARKLGYIMYK